MIVGLVLAGGRSSRYGSEKAVARLDGETLLERALAVLRGDCAALAVSARPDSGAAALASDLGLPVLPDADGAPDGPLAGVAAGLRWAAGLGAEALVTLPCDLPRAPTDLVGRLAEGRAEAFAAFATTAEGVHPLCALWSVDLLASLDSALADGHPAVQGFLTDVAAAAVPFADAAAFANMNRPDDLRTRD